jgi:UDP-2,3-diacylglucosamine pyrophosphatase LpxH
MVMSVYNPGMRVAVISDVHCAGLQDAKQLEFLIWLDGLEADQLWMLGDIFHTGWAFGDSPQAELLPVMEALARLRARGCHLVFVGGNHDFALVSVMERLGAEVRTAHRRQIDGRTVFVAHGDEADRSVGYRLTQAVLRGRAFGTLVRCLGEVRGTRLLSSLAGDQKTELSRPSDRRAREWLRSHLGDGTSLGICGHFHLVSHEAHAEGEVVTLGAGGGHRAIWLVDGQLQEGSIERP